MVRKFLVVAVSFVIALVFTSSFASVEVNKTDQAGLDGIRGIGPSLSKTILAARDKGGVFKDWADLENRVKGISDKNSVKFSKQGLVVNGQSKEGASPAVSNSKQSEKNASARETGAASTE